MKNFFGLLLISLLINLAMSSLSFAAQDVIQPKDQDTTKKTKPETAVENKALEDSSQNTLLDSISLSNSPIEIHGFLSQGFMLTTDNNYFPDSKKGTTDYAEAGMNFNKQLTTNLRAGFQLFARDFGRTGNYDAKLDWFLLDYRWRDWLGIRAGRVKIPYGLYNESNDYDASRNSILLPQSVYPTDQRDYLLAQTGIDLYGYIDLSAAGAIAYAAYRGTLNITPTSIVGFPYEVATSDVPYIHGGRLIWETPIQGLRLAGSYQQVFLKSDLWVPSLTTTIHTSLKVTMSTGSVEYINKDYKFAAEYARWWGDFRADTIIVPTKVRHERYYGMASFKAKEWLHPGISYSVTYPDDTQKTDSEDLSIDSGIFCRVDLTPNWIFKAEWHYIEGTAGLDPGINGGHTKNDMDRYWQMYLAKTTIFF